MANRGNQPVLSVRDLQVYYGASHALQGVDLTLHSGVHAVVGRNGMGKTTLCNAIMGMQPVRAGSIKLDGAEITSKQPHVIASMGVGYTPQGRRLWRSLTVDEHLRMLQKPGSAWSLDRVYETFPRLAERRNNGGAQLSGGEQQMLAIGRALLQDPHLLVLDEPTEGLAPVIVQHVEDLLHRLAEAGDVAILLVEQNIGVATSVAEDVAIMVGGRITTVMDAATLGDDRALQQQLLGVGRQDAGGDTLAPRRPARAKAEPAPKEAEPAKAAPEKPETAKPKTYQSGYTPPTRWSRAKWGEAGMPAVTAPAPATPKEVAPLYHEDLTDEVLVVGTFDTKSDELTFIVDRLKARGITARSVDVSTGDKPSSASIPPHQVAAYHPDGPAAVFTKDRGSSVTGMATALEAWTRAHNTIKGMISAGGSGGTALVTPAMRSLPIGVPKVMISTVASGNVAHYVGPSDMVMIHSVTDVQGLNRISRRVLGNGADAFAGMLAEAPGPEPASKPAIGLSMFGVTTPCVQRVIAGLEARFDCMVFHATGTGGRTLESLAGAGELAGVLDLTTTEIADLIVGGVFTADETRLDVFAQTRMPYIGSVGAVDMVNFGEPDTVPEKFAHRKLHVHNPQVTIMRTTPAECAAIGNFIANKLNKMEGPVRFLLPLGGVSAMDAPGKAFHDDEARAALYDTLTNKVEETANRRLIRHPGHINDPSFADEVLRHCNDIMPATERGRHATN